MSVEQLKDVYNFTFFFTSQLFQLGLKNINMILE